MAELSRDLTFFLGDSTACHLKLTLLSAQATDEGYRLNQRRGLPWGHDMHSCLFVCF